MHCNYFEFQVTVCLLMSSSLQRSSTWLMQIIMQNFHESESKMGSLRRNRIMALESPGLQSVAGDKDAVPFHWFTSTLVVKEEGLLFYKDPIYSNTPWMLMHPYIFFFFSMTLCFPPSVLCNLIICRPWMSFSNPLWFIWKSCKIKLIGVFIKMSEIFLSSIR